MHRLFYAAIAAIAFVLATGCGSTTSTPPASAPAAQTQPAATPPTSVALCTSDLESEVESGGLTSSNIMPHSKLLPISCRPLGLDQLTTAFKQVLTDLKSSQPSTAAPPTPSYTVAQQQAIASAESYLSDGQGFSRLGLIDQLSSKYGEGFSHRLAVFAVNHVQVNWRQQAVISARAYLQTEPGWSYAELVSQLSSPYGGNFTPAQAAYAAHKVGL